MLKIMIEKAIAESLLNTVPEMLREHLSTSLKPKQKKTKYSLEQEKAQVMEMVKNVARGTLKEVDLEKIMVEKLEAIDWQAKARETVDLTIKRLLGVVE